jgi:stage II sporulation protein D
MMGRRPPPLRAAECAVLLALAAAACGDPGPPPSAAGPQVRVAVAVDVPAVALDGASGLVVSAGDGRALLRAAPGERVRVEPDPGQRGRLRMVRGADTVAAPGMLVATAAAGAWVRVDGTAYRGEVVVRRSAGRLTAVNRLAMEDYLLGVVPREIGPVGEELAAAARAQAVASRTYALRRVLARPEAGVHLHASTRDQVYGGMDAERPVATRAVRATRGQALLHRGEPIDALYHSTCDGATAARDEVWGGPAYPYLAATRDVSPRTGQPYDRESRLSRWTVRWSAAELAATLAPVLRDSLPAGARAAVTELRTLDRLPSRRAAGVRVSTTAGDVVLRGEPVRWLLRGPDGDPLPSMKFYLVVGRDAWGALASVTAQGRGWGHGVGMCQFGAIGRAREGQDHRTILRAYYRRTSLRRLY